MLVWCDRLPHQNSLTPPGQEGSGTLRDISRLLRTAVPRGTAGTIVEVRHYGTVLVQFDNGRTVGVSEDDLERF